MNYLKKSFLTLSKELPPSIILRLCWGILISNCLSLRNCYLVKAKGGSLMRYFQKTLCLDRMSSEVKIWKSKKERLWIWLPKNMTP